MELSYFLAQIFGLTLMIFAVVGFVRPAIIVGVMRDLRPFSLAVLIAGFIGIVGGLAIILSHNIWVADWRIVITLFGWVALLKGITYVAFPEMLVNTTTGIFEKKRNRTIALWLAFLLGVYLVSNGFEL